MNYHVREDRFTPSLSSLEHDQQKRDDPWNALNNGFLSPRKAGSPIFPESRVETIEGLVINPGVRFPSDAVFSRSGTVVSQGSLPLPGSINLFGDLERSGSLFEQSPARKRNLVNLGLVDEGQTNPNIEFPGSIGPPHFNLDDKSTHLGRVSKVVLSPPTNAHISSQPKQPWEVEDFRNLAGLIGAAGEFSRDEQFGSLGRSLSYLSLDPTQIASELTAHTGLSVIAPAFDVIGLSTSLVNFAQSSSIYRLPFATFDPKRGQTVLYPGRRLAPDQDFNPYRDRGLVDVLVKVEQPWWRDLFAGLAIAAGGLLSIAAPLSGGVFMGASLADRIGGMVRLRVPRGMQIPAKLTWDEITRVAFLTYLYLLST